MGETNTLAIIGATGFAAEELIPQVTAEKNACIVGIQGRNQAKLDFIARQYNIPHTYTDVKTMLDACNPGLIYICTPPFLHKENLDIAFRYDAGILCEKPLAQNLAEAELIARAYHESRCTQFHIGHQIRHQEAMSDLQHMLTTKEIGDVVYAHVQWGYELDAKSKLARWKWKSPLGGDSVFVDPGIHAIDLSIALFGTPRQVSAHGFSKRSSETYDNATCLLTYDDCTVTIHNSQTMPHALNGLDIYGTQGSIHVPQAMSHESIAEITITKNGKTRTRTYGKRRLYAAEVDAMHGKPRGIHPTSFAEAMLGMRIIDAIHQSIQANRTIHIKSANDQLEHKNFV